MTTMEKKTEAIKGMSNYIDSMLYAMFGSISDDCAKAPDEDPNIIDAPWEVVPTKLPRHKLRWEKPRLMALDDTAATFMQE